MCSDIIYPPVIYMLHAYSVRDWQMYSNNSNKNEKIKVPAIFKDIRL